MSGATAAEIVPEETTTAVVDEGDFAPEDGANSLLRVTPAASDGVVVPQAALCTLKLGKPWKENIAATGRSDHARGKYNTVNNCNGYSLGATLQYHRWHGWSGLKKDTWAGNRPSERILQWKCQGEGTFTYRVEGTVRGGSTGDEPRVGIGHGPERRFNC
ncbi:hypothetical protein ABZX85_18890 [Streptomyces sp. NPDC004539]|uniref:hypothetical protein n=1 Tax=Streptomyces sp. NPDC004539 TaxID=3154280 RepID=UPI0033BD34DD